MLLLRLSCKSQRANRVVKFVFQCSTIAGVKSGSKRCSFEFGAVFKTLLPADETRKTHSDGGKETVNTHATPRVWAPTQTRGGSPSKKMVTQITSRVTPLTMEQNAYLDGTTGRFRTVRASSATWTHAAPGSCNGGGARKEHSGMLDVAPPVPRGFRRNVRGTLAYKVHTSVVFSLLVSETPFRRPWRFRVGGSVHVFLV